MQRQEDLIVGLDIGTTKICAVVGEISGSDINIIGIGTHPSIGLRKGVVINIESTVESIKKAVEEAELMAGCEISSVYAGIAGGHITGFNSRGIVAIKGSEISENDVERVIDAARAVAIPMDREVIHVLPQEFIVDDEAGIQNPVGMAGVRLEAKIHIVTGAVASAHNLVKCANRSGLDVSDIVLESLASGEAVLTDEEKQLGTALLGSWRRNHRPGGIFRKKYQTHICAGAGRQQPDKRHCRGIAGTPGRGRKDKKEIRHLSCPQHQQ
jgi:cell division protein FtsA